MLFKFDKSLGQGVPPVLTYHYVRMWSTKKRTRQSFTLKSHTQLELALMGTPDLN